MKILLIVRHAKTEAQNLNQQDFDRKLTDRGHSDAEAIGQWLLASGTEVDAILSSTAQRARETTAHINQHLGMQHNTQWVDDIYAATTATLRKIVGSAPDSSKQVLLVGHNPGLQRMISGLCCDDEHRLNISLPTAGVAMLALDIRHWNQIRWGCGELRWFVRPKLLRDSVLGRRAND